MILSNPLKQCSPCFNLDLLYIILNLTVLFKNKFSNTIVDSYVYSRNVYYLHSSLTVYLSIYLYIWLLVAITYQTICIILVFLLVGTYVSLESTCKHINGSLRPVYTGRYRPGERGGSRDPPLEMVSNLQ